MKEDMWKPWYRRIPGAFVGSVGFLLMGFLLIPAFLFMLGMFLGSLLVDKGGDMMRKKGGA